MRDYTECSVGDSFSLGCSDAKNLMQKFRQMLRDWGEFNSVTLETTVVTCLCWIVLIGQNCSASLKKPIWSPELNFLPSKNCLKLPSIFNSNFRKSEDSFQVFSECSKS